jgi:hypothetical protein
MKNDVIRLRITKILADRSTMKCKSRTKNEHRSAEPFKPTCSVPNVQQIRGLGGAGPESRLSRRAQNPSLQLPFVTGGVELLFSSHDLLLQSSTFCSFRDGIPLLWLEVVEGTLWRPKSF